MPTHDHDHRAAKANQPDRRADGADEGEDLDGSPRDAVHEQTTQGESDELAAARAEAGEYLDQARRARAELQNYRRRAETEMEQARRRAGERILSRLLPVADDFHRALSSVPENELNNPWVQGILLIERKLWSILETEGVQPIEAVGRDFDPSLHEAVSMDSGGGNQVVEEYQRGYTLHDRVIRPAMVKVGQGSARPESGNGSSESAQSEERPA